MHKSCNFRTLTPFSKISPTSQESRVVTLESSTPYTQWQLICWLAKSIFLSSLLLQKTARGGACSNSLFSVAAKEGRKGERDALRCLSGTIIVIITPP